jgi:hypothetical protein
LILIFVFDFFLGKTFQMRRNSEVAHSSHGRTIIPTEVVIVGATSRRINENGARESRGGRGVVTSPRGGRGAAASPKGGRGGLP